jgi:hypothetical protein
LEEAEMHIQYVGFSLSESSRVYSFHVIDTPENTREFTVKVQSEAFRGGSLKLQDGPGMCLSRLKQELEGEVEGSPAEAGLNIRQQDIQEYVSRQYPGKASGRKRRAALEARLR